MTSFSFLSMLCFCTYHSISSFRARSQICMKVSFRDDKFISTPMLERLYKGTVTSNDVDKIFTPSKNDLDYCASSTSVGFTGVILSLDTVLLDLNEVLSTSYELFAGEIQEAQPDISSIKNVIGSSFQDAMLSLKWNVPADAYSSYEKLYFEIVNKCMDMLPVYSHKGAEELLNDLINNGDEICVMTSLPRPLAVKALRKSFLSSAFEGRVSPENLISLRDEGFEGEQHARGSNVGHAIIKSCASMKSPTLLAALIDGNWRNLIAAKRLGLTCIALQGYSADPLALKSGDKIVRDINSLSAKEIYKVVRRRISMSEGPAQQTATADVMIRSTKLSVSAPFQSDNRVRDTFAEEYGSDSY